MATVVLVIHLMIAVALVATVLIQRSEGGALGIGGGGGMMAGRGSANLLTRATTILGAAFFATSIILTVLAQRSGEPPSIIDQLGQPATQSAPATPTGEGAPASAPSGGGILDALQPATPQVPQSQ
ncbi:MAG: preprotein translocase subunit SecG [Rhizobiales bacterium]|nr:preprotein translocase subunit SecG [Hyphomicrobiales bacterium]